MKGEERGVEFAVLAHEIIERFEENVFKLFFKVLFCNTT